MGSKIWVLKCVDGCKGVSASLSRDDCERTRKKHKEETGHKMRIGLQSREFIEF